MANTVKVFDWEMSSCGVSAFASRQPLMAGCMSDGEIDANIDLLIADLNSLRPKMKAALKRELAKPLALG